MNSKIETEPKLKVEDKDRVNNSLRIKMVKLKIVKLKASLNLVLSRKSWLAKYNVKRFNLSRYQM